MSGFDKQRREREAKRGVDVLGRTEKRRETAVTLRKKAQEQEIKRLRESRPEDGQCVISLQELPMVVAQLASPDVHLQLQATSAIRRALSIEENPPVAAVIESGCVATLVEFLRRFDCAPLQFEAAWALTNIASDTSEHTAAVISGGAVPLFIDLLSSPSEDVREQSVWALGNIAGDSAKCRDLILNLNVMDPLLQISRSSPSLTLLRNVTWTLSNLCRGKPIPDFVRVRPALPVLAQLLFHGDEEVLSDACWAISYLSDGENECTQSVLDQNIHLRLIDLLTRDDTSMTPALRTIGNIVTGTETQTQTLISCGMLPHLHYLLQHPKKGVRKECCWAISNITAGTTDQIQSVINASLIPPVIRMLSASEYEVRKEAAWAISNAVTGGTADQVKYMVAQNCTEPLCELLGVPDAKIIMVALEAIENILRVGEEEREATKGTENLYLKAVIKCDGLDRLESLQVHPNQEVYELAFSVIESFFDIVEEFDGAAQQQTQQHLVQQAQQQHLMQQAAIQQAAAQQAAAQQHAAATQQQMLSGGHVDPQMAMQQAAAQRAPDFQGIVPPAPQQFALN